jgi:acetylornithine/succinyldiaminopimelate/putrescine aminotransferase
MQDRYELLAQVRGRGLMIGIEFGRPQSLRLRGSWELLQLARRGLFAQLVVVPLFQREGILTQVAADGMPVVKLIPPLVIGETDVDLFLEGFDRVMDLAHRGALLRGLGLDLARQALRR